MAPSVAALGLVFILTSSTFLQAMSFTLHRRHHGRKSGLADALRMLDRQRRRLDKESISPLVVDKPLDRDSMGPVRDFPEAVEIGDFLDAPVQPSSKSISSSSSSSSAESLSSPPRLEKKDKEVMTNVVGDARPRIQTRSGDGNNNNNNNDVSNDAGARAVTSSSNNNDVSVTKEEFKALLRAVERIQEEAIEKVAEEEEEEEEQVMEEVQQKIAEAREEAKEETAEKEVMEELAQSGPGEEDGDLQDLFREESEEVIPTEDGGIVDVDSTLINSEGAPVAKEQALEEVQTYPGLEDSSSDDEDLWFLKDERRKRDSRRRPVPSVWLKTLAAQSAFAGELIQAYSKKVAQLQTSLDQAEVQSYLEDVENDLLTEALDQATLSQLHPDQLPLRELSALRDAIRVEEMLQEVKGDGALASHLADQLPNEVSSSTDTEDQMKKKRGEPWRKRNDVMEPEVPVYIMGTGNGVEKEPMASDVGFLGNSDEAFNVEDPFLPVGGEVDSADDDLIGAPAFSGPAEIGGRIASLFSDDADQCPAVQAFSSNCRFAGNTVDYEARALCNLHEMCYVCGATLKLKKKQCDFIYRAASEMLCEGDRRCGADSELFLNAMKLKHRFAHYHQPLCRAPCAARFLSVI